MERDVCKKKGGRAGCFEWNDHGARTLTHNHSWFTSTFSWCACERRGRKQATILLSLSHPCWLSSFTLAKRLREERYHHSSGNIQSNCDCKRVTRTQREKKNKTIATWERSSYSRAVVKNKKVAVNSPSSSLYDCLEWSHHRWTQVSMLSVRRIEECRLQARLKGRVCILLP